LFHFFDICVCDALFSENYRGIMSDEVKTWGGKREGAGRPKLECRRRLRGLKFNDTEWTLIRGTAAARGISARAYLMALVENDTYPTSLEVKLDPQNM
jgi:hypothetical protein